MIVSCISFVFFCLFFVAYGPGIAQDLAIQVEIISDGCKGCSVSQESERMEGASSDLVDMRAAEGLNWPWIHLHGHFAQPELSIPEAAPRPHHFPIFTHNSQRVVLATGNRVNIHVLETDHFSEHSHVRGNDVSPAGPVQRHVIHFFDIGVKSQLPKVVDPTPVKFTLVGQHQRDGRPTLHLCKMYILRHQVFGDFSRQDYFAFLHAYSRLERVLREAKSQLTVHADTPDPQPA